MTPLWLDPDRRAAAVRAFRSGEPWIVRLAEAVNSQPSPEAEQPVLRQVVRLAVAAWLNGGTAEAEQAADLWERECHASLASEDLHKAHVALVGAVLVDGAGACWTSERRQRMTAAARELVGAFMDVSPGNPHAVGNNWWAVTHSGLYCLVAALQALGDGEPVRGRTPAEWEAWCWGRLRAFLGHFGPDGAYHEGLGYQGYTCANLLPAVLLRRARGGPDPVEEAPGLARMASLLFAAAIEGPALSDETGRREGWGRMLSWNDAGLGWLRGPAPLLALCLAPPGRRAGLRARWDRLGGHLAAEVPVDEANAALFFHAAYYLEAGGDGTVSPLEAQVCDGSHGLWLARNRVRDAADAVAGAYARTRHPGGHTQHDAGSVRFSALGWDWILGGGQARPEARWQSRLVPSDHDDRTKAACGAVLFQAEPAGARVFGMDLRPVHQAYSERYVALRSDPDAAHLAVLDLVDDHRSDRAWIWCVTFSPELSCEVGEEGFRLKAPDGAVLDAVFLFDRPESIELTATPPSRRTYVSRKTVEYPGRPVLMARFAGPSVNIYVSMRATAGPVASVRLAGPGTLDLEGPGGLWKRPFDVALPERFTGRLRGQCRHPAGG